MARNGSGVYSLPSGNPVVTGTTISSNWANNTLTDVATALTGSLAADGQTAWTGNQNAGNNKITSLAAGSQPGESVRWQQLFSQGVEQTIASATTIDIGAQNTCFLNVTGTTTISSFGSNYNGPRYLRFAAQLTLTNSATLICPNGADVQVNAGDIVLVIPKATSGASDGWYIANITNSTGYTPTCSSSVAANALTGSYNGAGTPHYFRNGTLSNGSTVTQGVGALSLTVPTGATLGMINGIKTRLIWLVAYNGGVPALCVINQAGNINLDEMGLISTTAISGSATSDSVIYSASAITNSPYLIVGYSEITEGTAGTWATAASKNAVCNGERLQAISCVGYGGNWVDVTASRVSSNVYYNISGRAMPVKITSSAQANTILTTTVKGVQIGNQTSPPANFGRLVEYFIVPPWQSYFSSSNQPFAIWAEMQPS